MRTAFVFPAMIGLVQVWPAVAVEIGDDCVGWMGGAGNVAAENAVRAVGKMTGPVVEQDVDGNRAEVAPRRKDAVRHDEIEKAGVVYVQPPARPRPGTEFPRSQGIVIRRARPFRKFRRRA